MTETLEKVGENRDDNRKLLEQKKSSIIKQISTVKSKLLKYIDDLEERLINEVASVQEKNNEKIKGEKKEMFYKFGQKFCSILLYLWLLSFHRCIFNRTRSGNL
jgi:gas vesicle protein